MSGPRIEPRDHAAASDIDGIRREIAAAPGRHIDLPGTMNLRDIGGYPLTGGGFTRWRTLLRSDSLHKADARPDGQLTALRLRTVVDLRTIAETEYAPSPMDDLAAAGTVTRHVSILGEDFEAIPRDLPGIYRFVITERGPVIGAAIAALTRPDALPALVHCTAGKDRTGIVIALTLAAIGVPDEFAAADYSLTDIYLDPKRTPMITQLEQVAGLGEELPAAILESPADLMLATLDLARQVGGSIEGYLGQHGVTADDLARLQTALTSTEAGPGDTGPRAGASTGDGAAPDSGSAGQGDG